MQQWIEKFLQEHGPLGVGVMMLLENIFPPLPSEIVMPWAGYGVSRGEMSFLAAVSAGSLGSFVGVSLWYGLARWIGKARLIRWVEKHGWWLTLSKQDIERTDQWFDHWGPLAVLICRMIPGVRTLISVPAGFAEMPLGQFSVYTAIGTVLWTALLTAIGWWLGNNYAQLAQPLSWVSAVVVGAFFAWWLVRLIARS